MLEELYRDAQHLLHSRYLSYAIAGVCIVVWIVASRVVGLLRHARSSNQERPRRRLPLG